ncbi:hypothetical protein ACJW31_08G125000 [Castanea mollissima]
MAYKTFTMKFFSLLISSFAIVHMVKAGDPDILSDFIVPANVTTVDGNFFTFIDMLVLVKAAPPTAFKSVSFEVLQFPAGTPNPPHTHPCAFELLFLVQGTLHVGFVDTTNKLFTQTLQSGDIFVFPKGLVHFQYNADPQGPALAISAFGSANAGTVSIPNALFTTGIDNNVLAKSFKTDVATIQSLKAGLAPKT